MTVTTAAGGRVQDTRAESAEGEARRSLASTDPVRLHELIERNRVLEWQLAESISRCERLRRFLPPQVDDALCGRGNAALLKVRRCEVTVLFVDLRRFSGFVESVEPEEVSRVLTEYHAVVGRLTAESSGTIERFSGDAVMVFFEPTLSEQALLATSSAVRLALAIRDELAKVAEHWRTRGYDLGAGFGLSKGYASVGPVGFEGRRDYAAIGRVTNLASRLCAVAKPAQILACPRIIDDLKDRLDYEFVREFRPRGWLRSVSAFNVLKLHE
jgi:class 3 adenylate cyclase